MIMTSCMTARGLIATPHVSAGPTDSEVNPHATGFQALFAAARARCNISNGAEMQTAFALSRAAPMLVEFPLFARERCRLAFVAPSQS
jgi:hypothetical protein